MSPVSGAVGAPLDLGNVEPLLVAFTAAHTRDDYGEAFREGCLVRDASAASTGVDAPDLIEFVARFLDSWANVLAVRGDWSAIAPPSGRSGFGRGSVLALNS